MVSFLLANGLLSYNSFYSERSNGYYDFDIIIMMVSFMYLCRIKTPEQLKHHSPGELGKLLGLDRVPEAKCLRAIIRELTDQEKSAQWNAFLARYGIQKPLFSRLYRTQRNVQTGEETPLGLILCAEGGHEQIELLQLDHAGIKVAEYLTELPDRQLLKDKLHKELELKRRLFENKNEENNNG